MIAKTMRPKAEIAALNILKDFGCTHFVKAIVTKFQKVDMFACDIMAKSANETFFVQVTTGGYEAVRVRKKKLEAIPWLDTDKVFMFQLIDTGTRIGRSKVWVFNRWQLCKHLGWVEREQIRIDNSDFKHRKADEDNRAIPG